MKAVVQRVSRGRVTVEGEITGQIGLGMVVLLGVAEEDSQDDVQWLAKKIVGLRIFDDEAGKMNLSLADVGGAMLVVSQFTLLGDCRKGRRPSFVSAALPEKAAAFYESFIATVVEHGIPTETGKFRAQMDVSLVNDGPVTLILDTCELR